MDKGRILVIDDKESMLGLFSKILGDAHLVTTASDGARGLALILSRTFDVVVSDIKMPGADGFEILKAVKEYSAETEVVLMTAFASVDKAVEAIKLGAYDYIKKPFDPDDVALIVARALERKRLREQATSPITSDRLRRLVGKSQGMREVGSLIDRAAANNLAVMLVGEQGTGRELAARDIHQRSARRDRPFIAMSCKAIPSELTGSELFGDARAFAGENAPRRGLLEEANGGTLFLEDVGELPPEVQLRLHRTLEAQAIDVRVIAASPRDLRADVDRGSFLGDLFQRLHALPIRLPALRERREDLPLLATHFLDLASKAESRSFAGFEPDALRAIIGYSWPGNVRELENAIESAVAVAPGPQIALADLPPAVRGPQQGALPPELLIQLPYREAVERARDQVSREYLIALMREFHGNVTRAADRAGMERESLHRLLRRYNVRSEDFKTKS